MAEYSGRPRDSEAMFDRLLALAGNRESILQTWPMGLARNPRVGRNWDTEAPSGVPDHAQFRSLPHDSRARLPKAMPLLFETTFPSGSVVTVTVENGFGAILIGNDTTRIHRHTERKYCLADSCQCDDGRTHTDIESVNSREALIALTGHLTEGSLLVMLSEPPCESEENTLTAPSNEGAASATSHGDPHIVTYDGYRYSFHTIGEFWLTRSIDGRFAVQVRQSPVPARRQLSLNSAVAMRVGDHRVAIYSQGAPDGKTRLWIDGMPTPLEQATRKLPGGGSVNSRGGNRYTVQWPTGEYVTVGVMRAGGASFLNITPWVSREYAGRLEGLFGDLDGNPLDDLRTRDGRLVPSENAYAPIVGFLDSVIEAPVSLTGIQNGFFRQLYRDFGSSWRISDEESLFDYAPGMSTETFTDRAYPASFPTLVGVAVQEIEEARKLCQTLEVADEFMEGCVFDVAATGERGFAESAANAVISVLIDQAKDRVREEVKNEIKEEVNEEIKDKVKDELRKRLLERKWF